MGRSKTFALLGFPPDTELQVKSLLHERLGATKINWVSATDPKLEGVVINSDFLSSPQVKKYIAKTHAKVACCFRDQEGEKQAIESGVIGININNYDNESLAKWVHHLYGSTSANKNSQRTLNNGSSNSNDYVNLITELTSSSEIFVAKNRDLTTWIDKRNNFVYIDFGRNHIPGIDSLNWETVSDFTPPKIGHKISFDLWLFVAIWHSNIDFTDKVSETDYYKLQRWPRPLSAKRRAEALRLSAFIQSQPGTVQQLVKKSGYDKILVCRFIFAALTAGQIKVTHLQPKVQSKQTEKKIDTVKLGLVSRLRKKLGFG